MRTQVILSRFAVPFAALAFLTSSALAAETLPPNAGFDGSADGWAWESWSAPGNTASYDSAQDSEGLATSGSLQLDSNFSGETSDYQQAVYTFSLPAEINAGENYGSLSFDVRVDPASFPRLEGDYGTIQVILRNGDSWDWADLAIKPLVDTEWRRFTFNFDQASGPIDSVRGITIKIAQSGFFGPVHLNLDNLAYNDEVIIDALDHGEAGLAPAGWSWETWSAAGSMVMWDPLDFGGRATSGSALLDCAFQDISDYQQAVFTLQLPAPVNAVTDYSQINLDIKVEPSSTPGVNGDYGYFEIILRNGSTWDWISTGPGETTGTTLTSTEWTHISMPFLAGDEVVGITFKLGGGGFQGPITLRIDNVTWTENSVPPPPPSLQIAAAKSGLNLVTTSTDTYGRHNIYAVDNGVLGWYDAAEPVTYEFSLLDFPDAAEHPGFQAHIFLVPGTPGEASSADWNEPSLIFLDIKAGEDDIGNATLRWKVNEPGGNSQLYVEGLPTVTSASVLGTWKITASENSHLVVTAPDGTTVETDLPAEIAAEFAGPIRFYIGAQPNANANIGQRAIVGHARVSQGATVWLEDDFAGEELDSQKWIMNATAGGVQLIPLGQAGYLVTWGLPDSGFLPQFSPNLTTPDWSGLPTAPINLGPLLRQIHVPQAALPPGGAAFFRLIQQGAQVAPAGNEALSAFIYTLTPETGADWTLFLTYYDDVNGAYTLAEEFGDYTASFDLSNNRWNLLLLDGAEDTEQMLRLEFATGTTGNWTLIGPDSSLSGAFTAEPLF